ncbi:ribosome recycling factor [SAR86 cluster bacterium]|jgi:ribosome recycling factor|nr:ribosome recycling factor [SAR86 cluster bacterium]|tara:strand:+ start:230 stop:784 length:555 start_codon:yes stop_codon:yes gene_type:complete
MENLISDLEDKMQKTIASLNNEFKKIRTGRANPSMLDDIKIDYYGSPTPINQAASISVEEGRTLTISPWDKSLIEDIEKAIMKSDLGLNPNTSGDLIRLTMPVLTEETRGDYIKQAKNEAENAKIAIRNIRRDANNHAKDSEKNNEISQDEMKRLEAEVQRVTDTFIESIENELKKKEADLSEI